MSLQEDIKKVEEKAEKASLAMELLQLSKQEKEKISEEFGKANRRLIWLIVFIIFCWLATIGGFLYYINTTGFEETTETAETTDGGNACVGDNCNNGEITYGESDEKD
jgi:uncharacterized membrane protein (DUF106 family)